MIIALLIALLLFGGDLLSSSMQAAEELLGIDEPLGTDVAQADDMELTGNASYSVPPARLDRALACRTELTGTGRAEPVLLVHGTSVTRRENWGWNYWPALHDAGFEVCWIQLPAAGLNDIQLSAEYVARAIETMAAASGERIDVVGHSLGGLAPRWAIKWFPSGASVDDYVGFASPNHGTVTADNGTKERDCFESCWQMRTHARFIDALNRGDETPGAVSYTSIYTRHDELVQPPTTSILRGGTNVLLQEVCSGRPVEHLLLAGDAVTWELTIDALTHPGGADPDRLSPLVCLKLLLPGATLNVPNVPLDTSEVRYPDREPPLKRYARN